MERTPSPPRRVRTPPAPHHGAKYDGYEPFSPRRSSRVAAQHHLHHEQTSPTRPRTTRDVTPTSSKKKTATRPSNHTLSPPSSPISPAKHRSPRSTRRLHHDPVVADSDSDHAAPTPARRFLSTMAPHGMLPTPAKTPRKRALQSEDSLGATARVLFSNRPATVEEAMPSPRKARKIKKDVYTLESFAAQMEEGSDKIEIYTDSKERIPTRDDEEDNPFVTRKCKGKAKAAPQKARKVDEKTAKMFESAERDEGMVYLFRGKKIFRKFHDGPPSHTSEGLQSSDDELRQKAGHEAQRRVTRSAIKPRLLFQEEIQRLERENGHEDDEEAVTDIEVPIATPSRKVHKSIRATTSTVQEATPPPTTRVKRQISFDSWSRVKSSARSSGSSRDGQKRSGPPLESGADKRARSEHSGSAMSIDDF